MYYINNIGNYIINCIFIYINVNKKNESKKRKLFCIILIRAINCEKSINLKYTERTTLLKNLDTDLKITLLNQNNYVKRLNVCDKKFEHFSN